jgi:hypothetical protein
MRHSVLEGFPFEITRLMFPSLHIVFVWTAACQSGLDPWARPTGASLRCLNRAWGTAEAVPYPKAVRLVNRLTTVIAELTIARVQECAALGNLSRSADANLLAYMGLLAVRMVRKVHHEA